MKQQPYHKRFVGTHKLAPDTLMMSYGYDPKLSEGAVKPPLFMSSTFAFRSAEEGAHFAPWATAERRAAANPLLFVTPGRREATNPGSILHHVRKRGSRVPRCARPRDDGSTAPSKFYAYFSTPKYAFSGWRPRKRPKNADAAREILRRFAAWGTAAPLQRPRVFRSAECCRALASRSAPGYPCPHGS